MAAIFEDVRRNKPEIRDSRAHEVRRSWREVSLVWGEKLGFSDEERKVISEWQGKSARAANKFLFDIMFFNASKFPKVITEYDYYQVRGRLLQAEGDYHEPGGYIDNFGEYNPTGKILIRKGDYYLDLSIHDHHGSGGQYSVDGFLNDQSIICPYLANELDHPTRFQRVRYRAHDYEYPPPSFRLHEPGPYDAPGPGF